MTKEEMLERIIDTKIAVEEITTILYNSFLIIAWVEAVAKKNPDFYISIKPLLDSYRTNNPGAQESLMIADLLAEEGVRRASAKSPEKAKKDNIIAFPPWGIKLTD